MTVGFEGAGWADYVEGFEGYGVDPGDPFDDIPTGWFNDNGTSRNVIIAEDPNDPINNVYRVSIQPFGSTMYGAQEFSDFDISFRFLKAGINDDLNFLFRCRSGQTSYFYPGGYWIRIQAGRIRFSPNGDGGSLGNILVPVPHHVWHTMRVVAEGSHIEVYYDGGLIFDVQDPDPLFSTGFIGFRTERQVGYIDDIELIEIVGDRDGDGIPDDVDVCPDEDASGQDADQDGCIDVLDDLSALIDTLDVPQGTKASLQSKARNALRQAQRGRTNAAINILEALLNEVEALRGKKISDADADLLQAFVENVIAGLTSLPGQHIARYVAHGLEARPWR